MVLSYQSLKSVIGGAQPMITSSIPLISEKPDEEYVQPASLDLPIGNRCYRVSVSSAPKDGESVEALINRFALYDFEIKPEGALLERGMTYLIPLDVDLALSPEFRARFSSKSTTGRNGLFARKLSNADSRRDVTIYGYEGKLYAEVSPLRFHTHVYPGKPLTQMRLESRNSVPLTTEELTLLHAKYGIVRDKNGEPAKAVIADGALYLHLDLKGDVAGYASILNMKDAVHVGKTQVDDRELFWEPVRLTKEGDTVLQPPTFYLFATAERIYIPPCVCAYMEDYSAILGEFSSHEAGFFDNSFGHGGGTQGVLEVHPNRMPLVLSHGQPVCRMVFYRTDQVPEKLYHGHYTGSGPRLAKNYKNYREW
jgi:dCTP deaminase